MPKMRRNKLLSIILVVIFIALFANYFADHRQDFSSLFQLNPYLITVAALGYLSSFFANGLFIKTIVEPFGKRIPYREAYYVSLLSSIGNYFGPLMGGTGIRAVYLKKKAGIKYTDFISTLYGNYVIVFFVAAVFGIFSLFLLHDNVSANAFYPLALFFVGTAIGLIMVMDKTTHRFFEKILKKFFKSDGLVLRIFNSWLKILNYPGMVKSLLGVSVLNLLILMLINYVEFKMVGISLSLGALMLYAVLGSFSILISLTPGALGIREGIYLLTAGVIGVTSNEILAVALIDRSIQFLVMVLGWVAISLTRAKEIVKV